MAQPVLPAAPPSLPLAEWAFSPGSKNDVGARPFPFLWERVRKADVAECGYLLTTFSVLRSSFVLSQFGIRREFSYKTLAISSAVCEPHEVALRTRLSLAALDAACTYRLMADS